MYKIEALAVALLVKRLILLLAVLGSHPAEIFIRS